VLFVCAGMTLAAFSQSTPKITLDNNETVFTVIAAINHCGYDQGLSESNPIRAQVRTEMDKAVAASAEAKASSTEVCDFYRDHQQIDPSRTLAQYVSLALNMGEAPDFALKVKEAELPPDAAYVLGFRPLVQRFYRAVGLHRIWQYHQDQYSALVDRYHEPVSNLLTSMDVYLRMPISGYLGRSFVVLVEPMAAPGQVNARNYGVDYFLVLSPDHGGIQLDAVRHTYLHFVLDPLMLKKAYLVRKLQPLLADVQSAPLDKMYRSDMGLLTTESLIRAIEARIEHPGKQGEADRNKALDEAMTHGFVLARFFDDSLSKFEAGQVGLREALPDWLFYMDVGAERKRVQSIAFASQQMPEVMYTAPGTRNLLDMAEQRMASGDFTGASKLAQQAVDEKQPDVGRAYFLLAQAAVMNKDGEGARNYFERTLTTSDDPRIVAWSHIYLGRMADMQDERETALQHYRAALQAGDLTAETKAAAERGLKQPYEPHRPAE
jgi:hypothetical protein